jgi:predicted dehydrogenase/threonine dehydrogenase-like Zn-dependent dehydrogenase
MKQLAQYQDGRLVLLEVPELQAPVGGILVRTTYSVISPGTERMKVEQARMSLLAKARARPDQVRKVLDTARNVGWRSALEKVRNRLESPSPLGYSAAGVVIAVDERNTRFQVGDRVACGGAECAHHAELLAIPDLLAAPIPGGVEDWEAAHTTLCSIAMEAVREAGIALGDRVLILGQGLIGLLCTAMAKAAGARVLGVDQDALRLNAATLMGAECVGHAASEDIPRLVQQWTDGMGVDSVLICLGGKSTHVAETSLSCVRDRGTLMIVGMYDVELSWKTAYMKQVQVRYSRSYGPGRYDPSYEWAGQDYPAGYVRWTENRNFSACLQLMRDKVISLAPLVTRRAVFSDAVSVYSDLLQQGNADIGVLLQYDATDVSTSHSPAATIVHTLTEKQRVLSQTVSSVSIIGAGNFARTMLLPHLKGKLSFDTVVNATALSAYHVKEKFGFAKAVTDAAEVWHGGSAVVIATRHHLHAELVSQALEYGHHVFVEKPLCLNLEELQSIQSLHSQSPGSLMVGFNRRFSPAMQALKQRLDSCSGARSLSITVNAGTVAPDHWYARSEESGGRIIGEGCHFFDLACYLLGQAVSVSAQRVGQSAVSDSAAVQIAFADGSTAQIVYSAEGDSAFPKESYRLMTAGWIAESENALTLTVYEKRRRRQHKYSSKGHAEEMWAWAQYLMGQGAHPMSWASIHQSMQLTFAVMRSIRENRTVQLV